MQPGELLDRTLDAVWGVATGVGGGAGTTGVFTQDHTTILVGGVVGGVLGLVGAIRKWRKPPGGGGGGGGGAGGGGGGGQLAGASGTGSVDGGRTVRSVITGPNGPERLIVVGVLLAILAECYIPTGAVRLTLSAAGSVLWIVGLALQYSELLHIGPAAAGRGPAGPIARR